MRPPPPPWVLVFFVRLSMARSFSRDRPRFNDTLDVIKFLCKDLWSLVFGKNIDNLKTNHRVRRFTAARRRPLAGRLHDLGSLRLD